MRLIDADDATRVVESVLKKYGLDRESVVTDEIHDAIDNIQTAYDVEKVVEQLKEKSVETIPTCAVDGYSMTEEEKMIFTDEAVKIVNQVAEEYKGVTTCYLKSICEYQNEDIRVDDSIGWIPCDSELPPRPEIVDDLKAYLVTVRRNDGHIFWDKLFYHHFGWNIPSTCEVIAWQEPQPYQPKGE